MSGVHNIFVWVSNEFYSCFGLMMSSCTITVNRLTIATHIYIYMYIAIVCTFYFCMDNSDRTKITGDFTVFIECVDLIRTAIVYDGLAHTS